MSAANSRLLYSPELQREVHRVPLIFTIINNDTEVIPLYHSPIALGGMYSGSL